MKSVKKKFAFQLITSNAEIAVQFALSIILARLLDPEDIGIYSMSAILVAIAHIFRDFGVSSFIKRQKELSAETIKSALGVVMFTSWMVALTLYLSAPLWAAFFKEPRVEEVVKVLAAGFVFIPFGAIPGAVLVRDLEVVRTAKASLTALLVYFIASILLARNGFGYMTMAWANLINIVAHCVAIRWVSTTRMPFLPSFRGWTHIANFGLGTILTSSIRAFDNAIPDIFLGKMSSPTNVGLFSRANSTVNIASSALMPAVNYFSLPYLAKLHHQNDDLPKEICKITSYLATLLLPAMAMTALLSEEIIAFLYGAKWLPSAVVVPWLCLMTGVGVLFAFTQPALTGIGKPYIAGAPFAVLLILKIAIVTLVFDGSLASFAMGMTIGQFVCLPMLLWVNHRFLNIHPRDWLRAVLPVLVLTGVMGGCAAAVKFMLPAWAPLWTILVVAVPALLSWVLMLHLLRLPLYEEVRRLIAARR